MKLKVPWRKRKQLPVPAVCRNCGTTLVSHYCHNCGQYLFAGFNRSVKDIVVNAFDAILAWDSKLFNTLKYLLFYPGKLTKEYLSGKVIRYVHPTKLFWFVSIIFFTVFTLGLEEDVLEKNLMGSNIKEDSFELQIDNETENTLPEKRKDQLHLKDILDYVPYAMFLVIPFFALLLQVFFYKGQRYYSGYLIFAFHFHTFAFILFTLLSVSDHYFPNSGNITDILLLFIPPLYFIIALYVAYKPKIGQLIWKVPLIMLLYGIAVVTILLVFNYFIVRYVHGIHLFENQDLFE